MLTRARPDTEPRSSPSCDVTWRQVAGLDLRAPRAPGRRPSATRAHCSVTTRTRRPGVLRHRRRLFGVPTPQKLMAHRPALMLGLSLLWTSIERFGPGWPPARADAAARRPAVRRRLLNGHPSRRCVKENIDEATLAALRDWRASDHFSGREKAALELTEEIVADDREVSDHASREFGNIPRGGRPGAGIRDRLPDLRE